MNHKFMFSGQSINLDQQESNVRKDMQSALDKYFPSPNDFVRVISYKETKDDTFELVIARSYASNAGTSLGVQSICDHDESMLTGLDISAFQPFKPGSAMIGGLIPWYDDMVYAPCTEFCRVWKQMNKVMAAEDIARIKVKPFYDSIQIQVKYKS